MRPLPRPPRLPTVLSPAMRLGRPRRAHTTGQLRWLVPAWLLAALPGPGHAAGPGDLAGQWQCSSLLGQAALEFQAGGQLRFDGEPMAYSLQGNQIIVLQQGMPRPHAYVLRGTTLLLTTPEGLTLQCVQTAGRAGGAAGLGGGVIPGLATGALPGALPGAVVPGVPNGSLNPLLSGLLCGSAGVNHRSGSTQRHTRVHFDGQGRFSTGGDTSFSVPSGYGHGQAATDGGSYQVTAAQRGAPIRIRWASGEDDQAVVHHVVNGRIVEIQYGTLLLGMGLCNH